MTIKLWVFRACTEGAIEDRFDFEMFLRKFGAPSTDSFVKILTNILELKKKLFTVRGVFTPYRRSKAAWKVIWGVNFAISLIFKVKTASDYVIPLTHKENRF